MDIWKVYTAVREWLIYYCSFYFISFIFPQEFEYSILYYDRKIVSQLYNGDEELLSDFKEINKEIENHFSQFYQTNFDPWQEKEISKKFHSIVGNLNLTQIREHESLELDAEINLEEVQNALNSFQNNKIPGDDGFTKEFYEAFFDLIGAALLDSLNAGFESVYITKRQSYFLNPQRWRQFDNII